MIEKALNFNAYTCLYKPLQIDKLIQVLSEVHHRELGRALDQAVGMGG